MKFKRLSAAAFMLIAAACAHRSLHSPIEATTAPARETRSLATNAPASERPAGFAPILNEDDDPNTFPQLEGRTLNWRTLSGELEFNALVGPYSNADTAPTERFIRLATRSIDIEIYEMDDPAVRAALRDAMKKGVTVRIIKEPRAVGERCDAFGDGLAPNKRGQAPSAEALRACLDGQAFGREVVAAGGRFEKFNKVELCGRTRPKSEHPRCYQHGKIIVIDARLALISTGNFNATNLCDRAADPPKCDRDYTYVTRDTSVVQALTTIFARDLAGVRHDPRQALTEAGAELKMTVSPWSLEPLQNLLRSAQTSIQLQNQYVNPDSDLAPILAAKAREGVRVEVQLGDVCYYGRPKENNTLVQKRLMFQELESAGVRVRMFPKEHRVGDRPGYLHAKAIVIDGRRAWIGSVNGSSSSLNMNREYGVFFTHPARVSALSRFMKHDFEDTSGQTWQESFECHRGASGGASGGAAGSHTPGAEDEEEPDQV